MKFTLKHCLLLYTLMFMQGNASNLDILDETADQNEYHNTDKSNKSLFDLEDEKFLTIYQNNSNDKRLPAKTLELIEKHIDVQEYILAHYYVKLYLGNYSAHGQLDKVWFFGIQTVFLKFKLTESQEGLVNEILRLANEFESTFPQSIYIKEVKKIRDESIAIECQRNNSIASYYDKRGKSKAAAFYRAKNSPSCKNVSIVSKLKSKEKKSNLDLLNDDNFE